MMFGISLFNELLYYFNLIFKINLLILNLNSALCISWCIVNYRNIYLILIFCVFNYFLLTI
ncbi:hypothetical protein CXF88_03815 [Shewanella sp. ALD9]|nr:hypothetical protein CXF88_03815 [Shewanella sp. ALD9]